MIIDYTLITVLTGTSIMALTSGALGCFALLRQESLLADTISHAAFPGIALAFLLTSSTNLSLLLTGGALSGTFGTLLVHYILKTTPLKKDAALGFVLSVFFGFGLVVLTIIQKTNVAQQAVLNKFLFGNASTLLRSEITIMALLSIIVFVGIAVCWKELKMFLFDPLFTRCSGYSIMVIEMLVTTLLILAIVIGLHIIGVVLMSTMFVAPATAARLWTHNLRTMVMLASFFATSASIIGVMLSSMYYNMPTGPVIVVVMSLIVLVSIFSNGIKKILFLNSH